MSNIALFLMGIGGLLAPVDKPEKISPPTAQASAPAPLRPREFVTHAVVTSARRADELRDRKVKDFLDKAEEAEVLILPPAPALEAAGIENGDTVVMSPADVGGTWLCVRVESLEKKDGGGRGRFLVTIVVGENGTSLPTPAELVKRMRARTKVQAEQVLSLLE